MLEPILHRRAQALDLTGSLLQGLFHLDEPPVSIRIVGIHADLDVREDLGSLGITVVHHNILCFH